MFEQVLDKRVDSKRVDGAVLRVDKLDLDRHRTEVLTDASAGNLAPESEYAIASVTKMYTAALVVRLIEAGKIQWDQPVHVAFPDVTVEQALFQTSGLADFFPSVAKEIAKHGDRAISSEEIIDFALARPPKQLGNRAAYSDTNYELLGLLLEEHHQASFADIVALEIFEPLEMHSSRVADGGAVPPVRIRRKYFDVPLMLASAPATGAIVSTSADQARFTRAFFTGELFDLSVLPTLQDFRPMRMGVKYGGGLMKSEVTRALRRFYPAGELIGHTGINGAFNLYNPKTGLAMCGTLNYSLDPSAPFRFALGITNTYLKQKSS